MNPTDLRTSYTDLAGCGKANSALSVKLPKAIQNPATGCVYRAVVGASGSFRTAPTFNFAGFSPIVGLFSS